MSKTIYYAVSSKLTELYNSLHWLGKKNTTNTQCYLSKILHNVNHTMKWLEKLPQFNLSPFHSIHLSNSVSF